MPILNERKYYWLSQDKSILKTYKIDFDVGTKRCWYVEFQNEFAFDEKNFKSVIPFLILSQIKRKNFYLVISNYAESFTSVITPIYDVLVQKLEIPAEQIILLTGARDIKSKVVEIANLRKLPTIKLYWTNDIENHLKRAIKNDVFLEPTVSNQFSKKYINLNRNWRIHRPAFVSLLIAYNLINDGYVTLIESKTCNWAWEKVWDWMIDLHPLFKDIFIENKNRIISSTPLILDRQSSDINPNWHQPSLQPYFLQSYFTIVSETNFYQNTSRFFTEKVFLPIINFHPFLLLAPPNSLDALKELGYKTFHPFIDESYDSMIDDEKRMLAVLIEAKRLCSLNEYEVKEFRSNIIDICKYNYNVLKFREPKFIELN